MQALTVVNEWIAAAKEHIPKKVHIPLIDTIDLGMTSEPWDAWMLGDHGLREALENVLSRDPSDVAVRFVALNAYCQLTTLNVVADEGELESKGKEFRRHLAYLVRLRDIDQCTSLRDLRWEITNSVAIADYQRVDALDHQLKSILPLQEYHYLQGRLHFLIALAHTCDTDQGLEHWDLPIGPQPDGLRGVYTGINTLFLYGAGVN